jgi:Uma2 family endonuclease
VHVRASDQDRDPEVIELPRVVFPVELEPPQGFEPEQAATWPRVVGRLEWVEGRLLFMPPSGRDQSQTVSDVVAVLVAWAHDNPEVSVGSNETGMKLGDDVRAADAAVWRTTDLPEQPDMLPRKPPLLAVEVAGRDDTEDALREKAAWYRDHGVPTVWILFPASREVLVVDAEATRRFRGGDRLAAPSRMDGLTPDVASLFRQVLRSASTP